MKMFIVFVTLLLSTMAFAQWKVEQQDVKFPTQKVMDEQSWAAPIAAGAANILLDNAGSGSASSATVTTFLAQPDFARNLVVTPGGTTADVAAGNVTITGKDILGQTITEDFAFAANASAATTGVKAFKSISSIVFPGEDSPFGATWSVGFGAKLGLKRCMPYADAWIKGLIDGVVATGITGAASVSAVSGNTVIFNAAPNGTRNFNLWYVQNYRCK